MDTVCKQNECCGCYSCINICPRNAITIEESVKNINAVIDKNVCINCNLCKKACPIENKPNGMKPIEWYQGWAKDEMIRKKSSSGGIARSISEGFIDDGGIVCSCKLDQGKYIFDVTNSKTDLKYFQGSKYVKSCPDNVFKKIKELLLEKKKVLFIGLPCQVAAVKNYVGNINNDFLFTIDLICHGTPSRILLNRFLEEHNIDLDDMDDIMFRNEDGFFISSSKFIIEEKGVMDRYMIGFLNSIFYTENCYDCKYACSERVGDLTIGDSWGSELNDIEKNKGISLILCQTGKGKSLLQDDRLDLFPVEFQKAKENNPQLNSACNKPKFYDEVCKEIESGKKIDKIVFKYLKYKCLKQLIKKILIKMYVIK